MVHVDASLIRADVSWESLAVRHVDALAEANGDDPSPSPPEPGEERKQRHSRRTGRVQEGLRHRSRRLLGDQRAQPPPRAGLQAARGGRRRLRRRARRRGHHRRGQRGAGGPRSSRCGRRDHRRPDPDGDGGRRLRLRQGLRGSGGEGDRRRDPDQGRASSRQGHSHTALQVRRAGQHRAVSQGQDPAPQGQAASRLPVLPRPRQGLRRAVPAAGSLREPVAPGPRRRLQPITRRSCALDAGDCAGDRGGSPSTSAIAGARRASTARPRPGTAWRAPSAAASRTLRIQSLCAHRHARSTSNGSRPPCWPCSGSGRSGPTLRTGPPLLQQPHAHRLPGGASRRG